MTLQVLDQIGAAIQNATGVSVQCATFPPAWRNSSSLMDDEIFCSWSNSECLFRGGRQVFMGQDGQPDYPTARYHPSMAHGSCLYLRHMNDHHCQPLGQSLQQSQCEYFLCARPLPPYLGVDATTELPLTWSLYTANALRQTVISTVPDPNQLLLADSVRCPGTDGYLEARMLAAMLLEKLLLWQSCCSQVPCVFKEMSWGLHRH